MVYASARILSVLILTTFSSISETAGALSPLDPSSYSRSELVKIKHLQLFLNVDFENKVLNGEALLNFDILQDTQNVTLDISELNIESVKLEDGTKLEFEIGNHIPNYGSKLSIAIPQKVKNETLQLRIKYTTSPQASGLHWLNPNQTSGKILPYLFSQCGPIHARSVVPCQDTPAVKFTYEAVVTAPEGFTVLMSALRREVTGNRTSFLQPVPMPSYLLAIAVGALEYRTLGPRSRVWTEKEKIDESAWEFADTEKYLQAAERFCGPYEWTQYDLLVLPPTFPYGGMENPCLTFVTPSLLSGDRSQASVIIHEIVHSWTGNLVSIKSFEHFWLKEGFTVFLERKVDSSLIADVAEAKRSRDFESILGLQELNETINEQLGSSNPLSRLVFDLSDAHPDDAITRVPYEKGSLFLRYLEDLLGGPEVFDKFVRSYIGRFRYKSHDTSEFKAYLLEYFENNKQIKKVDWDTWLYGNGMPHIVPEYDTSMTMVVMTLLETISKDNGTFSHADVQNFTPHQLIHMLQELIDRPALSIQRLRDLGREYGIGSSKNAEILQRWFRLCIRSRDQDRLDDVFHFVNHNGRMKLVRPIYRDLYAWEEVRGRAIDNFLKHEPFMMHVSAYTLRQDLHLNN